MPQFLITSPDGQKFQVDAPEGATADDALAHVMGTQGVSSPPPTPVAAPKPTSTVGQRLREAGHNVSGSLSEGEAGLTFPGVGRGLKDIRDAGSQLTGHALDAVAPAGSGFEKWVKDQTGIVENRIATGEKAYQDERAAQGQTGVDSGRLVGNLLGTLPFGGSAAATLPGRVAGNALTGATAASVSQPVVKPENFWAQKAKQAELGAAGSVAMMPVTGAAARVASPNASTNPNIQQLLGEGVSLTPGQMAGGTLKRVEDAATSVPIAGDLIRNAQRGGVEDLNRAALNRVLAPIGQELPQGINVGREAVQHVQSAVQDAYRNLLPRLTVHADQQLVGDATQILQRLQATDPNLAGQFHNLFQRQVVDRFAAPGGAAPITGQTLKTMESELGEIATRYRTSAMGSERTLGQAVSDLQASLRDLVTRSNPQHAAELRSINEAFRNLTVIDRAAGGQGATGGIFSPNQLAAGVKGSDRSARDRNYAGGRATMQDLSDAAKAVMPSSVPDSGSALRLGVGAGLLGGAGMVSPTAAIGGAALASAYTPPGLWVLQQMMARRPQGAPGVARGLLDASPALGAAAAPPIFGLLN